MTTEIFAIIEQADKIAEDVTMFYCAAVGRGINSNEEFSLLVEWHDAIEAAIGAALSIRSWIDVEYLDKMKDECNMWLDHWKAAA